MYSKLFSPALVLALLLPLLATACRDVDPEPVVEPLPARSNILLITVDTLRADHLSSYGYPRETSPVIDRLAAEGVRFDQPAVQWPKTSPSFASMFTATYPKDNGMVRRVGVPLPCKFHMLAEVLQEQGYTNHAVVANGALASDFYFDQGFETYIETWKLEPGDDGQDPNRAEAVTELALGLLDQLESSEQPYFLWVHYLDPHFPYEPPEEARDRFQNDEHWSPEPKVFIADKPTQQMMGIGQEQVLDDRDELAFYVARYDAEIRYNDQQIGRLLDAMGERGLMENTLTVFTSDHGESLGEHGYYFDHGRFSFQTCLRVPFIVHYPGVLEPRVDEAPVELLHLAPTLLEAAGVELPEGRWMQGRSLTPRLRGMAPEPAAVEEAETASEKEGDTVTAGAWQRPPGLAFAEAGWETRGKWQKVVRDDRFKLVFAQTRPEQRWIGGEGVRFTLFDLHNDPEETENVAEQFPEDLERLKRELARWNGAEPFDVLVDPDEETCGDQRSMDDETRKLLESLGYL
ncbi:MAG: sulfatase [Acidobacteriota bacterium]|nr:sulfatase [Acidobacteriota bacterium]